MCVNFSSPYQARDAVAFCQIRNDPEAVAAIIQAGKAEGLSKSDELKALAEKGEYIPVLKAVWSERDRSRRLEWLRANASLHAPLMFELALAEFFHSPTIETIHRIALPLINAARLRVHQDCQCSLDPSVFNGDSHMLMGMTYVTSLANMSQKYLKKSLDTSGSFEGERAASLEKKLQTMRLSLSTSLPNPEWTKWRGMDAYLGEMRMRPSTDWQRIRADFARDAIAQLEKTT